MLGDHTPSGTRVMDIARAARLCFSADYAAARARFRDACRVFGIPVESHAHPLRGPEGEDLATDHAWIGPADAPHVVAVLSGTHGVEGFCGGGAQVDWLLGGGAAALPPGVAMLLIHAVNPFGWAWLSRTTEENVDLNRNWVDFTQALPGNDGYAALAPHLVPAEIAGPARDAADAALAAWRATRSLQQWLRAVSSGQYDHPEGLFYGGSGPTWARRTEEAIMDRHALAARASVTVLDMHTGLGPYGYGEPITHYDIGTGGSRRVRNFWGESVTESKRGQTAYQARDGLGHYGLNRVLKEPQTRLTMCTLEYGTFDRESGQKAFRADHWLHKYGDSLGKEAEPVRKAMRRQFYPETDDWKEAVLFRGHQLVRQALAGVQKGAL